MDPRQFLRAEGGVILALALGFYLDLGGPLWLLAVLALAPDLSMLGYLAGPRLGSRCYNVVHTYALPLVAGAAGVVTGTPLAVLVALVWVGHIGADRLLGYGLKFEDRFEHTHLSTQPPPADALTAEE